MTIPTYYVIAHLKNMYKIFDITEHSNPSAAANQAQALTEEYADRPAVQVSTIRASGLVDLVLAEFKDCALFSIHSMEQAEALGWDRPEVRDTYRAVRQRAHGS